MKTKTKRCSRCNVTKKVAEFYVFKARGGHQAYCKACNKDSRAVYYQNNKQRYRHSRDEHRRRLREEINEIKRTTPCTDCGNLFPAEVMDFDHLDPSTKIANVSQLVSKEGSRRRIREEIEKCEVVCSNCHRVRTHSRRNTLHHRENSSSSGLQTRRTRCDSGVVLSER